jgi:hypothetical protein
MSPTPDNKPPFALKAAQAKKTRRNASGVLSPFTTSPARASSYPGRRLSRANPHGDPSGLRPPRTEPSLRDRCAALDSHHPGQRAALYRVRGKTGKANPHTHPAGRRYRR